MAEQTRARYQGIWVPMDPAEQVATGAEQAGPRPGVAVAAQPTGLRFVASGTQRAGDTYDLRAQRAGYPTGLASGLGMLWRPSTSSDWRGFDEPATVTAWSAAVEAETGDPFEPRWPSALGLQSGELLIAYGGEDSSGSAEEVWVKRYDPITATYAAAVRVYVHPTLYASGFEACPHLVQLPSGRVLCFFLVYRPSGLNVLMAYSDDDGDTWDIGARDVLPAALEVNAAGVGATGYQSSHGLAVAYHLLGVSLVLGLRRADSDPALVVPEVTVLRQYASDSLGSSFMFIAETGTDNLGLDAGIAKENAAYPVLLHVNSALLLVHAVCETVAPGASTANVFVRLLGDPWQSWRSVTAVEVDINAGLDPGEDITDADMAAWVASNGAIYVLARGDDDILRVKRSQDSGATWEAVGLGSVTGDLDTGQYVHRLSACWWQERAVVLHQGDAGVGGTEPTVGLLMLGGWSTVPRAPQDSGYDPRLLAVLPNLWLPYTQPDLAGWGATGGGSFTLTPSGGVVDSTAAAKLYDRDPGGDQTDGVTVEVEVTPTSGGIASDQVILTLRLADGTDDYQVTIRIGTAAILARDDNAGASLGSVTVDTTAGVMILADMVNDAVRVYWRPRNIGSDRAYELLATSDTLTSDTATPAATNRITWGGSGLAVAEWHRVSWGGTTAVGAHLMDRSSPRDLPCLHPARSSVYIDRGLRVTPHDGPGYAADEWEVATAYDHPATALNPHLTPTATRGWRSTATASTNTHTWTLDTAGRRLPGLVALLCVNGNFRTANLRKTDGAGVVSTYATIDAATGLTGLTFFRSGKTIIPGAGAGSVYLHQSEAVGWSVDFGGGVVHRVVAQSEGQWGGTGRKPVLTLESVSGVGASGTCALVPSTWLAVVSVPLGDVWQAIGIDITAQTTADGDFRAGILWPGACEFFGFPPSWGAGGMEYAGDVEEIEFRDGTGQRVERSPQRRIYTAAWGDPLDLSRLSPGRVNPDHMIPWTSGRESVTYQATPTLLRGLLQDLRSGATPMAWIRRFPQASGSGVAAVVNRREAIFYGHVTSPITVDHVQGDPDHDEVVRVGNVTCREIR